MIPHLFLESGPATGSAEPVVTAYDICLPANAAVCAALGGVGHGTVTPVAPDRGLPRNFFIPLATIDEYYDFLFHWTHVSPDEFEEALNRAGALDPGSPSFAYWATLEWFRALEGMGHSVRVTVGFGE